MELGIEVVRGMTQLRIDKLGIVLGDNVSSKEKHATSKAFFEQQADSYVTRHSFL